MENKHIFASYILLIALITIALGIAAGLAVVGKLSEALVVLLTSVITGCFTLLRTPTSKNVTVDNSANDPIPVEPSK